MNKKALILSASLLFLAACQYSHVETFDHKTPHAWEYVPIKYQAPQPIVQQEPQELKKFTLDAASLFDFNKSDISVKGTAQTQSIAGEIINNLPYVRSIHVNGYTDPTGNAEANHTLSQARAQAVARVLESSGVPAKLIKTEGRGSSNLVVTDCNERFAKNKTGRDECNKPNRRVEISVIGLARQPGVPTMIDSKRYQPEPPKGSEPTVINRPDGLIERIEPAAHSKLPVQVDAPEGQTPRINSQTQVRENGWIETVVGTQPVKR
ncbi:OmpA family protein [Neisseria sp. 83E34]|uniref:OmpA family protein n=1 Tax=Neisseria sp. 83E34 TaxID=1692264 RepID=UPI0006CE6830|nr:OmpA family protein [Neisseria sp. 83E34]